MLRDPSLFNKLDGLALDDESAQFRFSDRLARENGWSVAFAKAAINEYKKFVYLAATSPTPVTPSNIVDQVWHLHLTYSRSYWDEMCGSIVGKPLHHAPTTGGSAESAKHMNLYAATLDAYRREFGEEPSPAFWPAAEARFDATHHQRWVDARTHIVVSRRAIAQAGAVAGGLIGLSFATSAVAAASAHAPFPVVPIGIGAAIALVAIVAIASGRQRGKGRGGDGSGAYGPFANDGSSHHGSHGGGHSGGHDGGGHAGCSGGGSDGGGCSSG